MGCRTGELYRPQTLQQVEGGKMTEATGGDVLVQVLQAVTGLQSSLENLQSSFTRFAKHTEEQFAQIDRRFDQVDQRLDRVEQRLDKVEQRLDRVEERLTSLEEQAILTNHRLGALEVFAERTDERFAQVFQSLTDLWTLARRLEQGFARMGVSV
jgi:chromosome segregation ATPase